MHRLHLKYVLQDHIYFVSKDVVLFPFTSSIHLPPMMKFIHHLQLPLPHSLKNNNNYIKKIASDSTYFRVFIPRCANYLFKDFFSCWIALI